VVETISYYFNAQNRYNIHSPFAFDFCENILEDERTFYAFEEIEALRKEMLKDNRKVDSHVGAGSLLHGDDRSISQVASSSLSRPYFCRILFHLVRHYRFKTILELGTSLGISTAYLSYGNLESKVYTFEGNPKIAAIANDNFQKLNIKNIQLIEGFFENTLEPILDSYAKDSPILIFLDGDHRYEAVMKWVELVFPKIPYGSFVVIDDIRWSKGMWQAWEELQNLSNLDFALDIFQYGILVKGEQNKSPQKFNLIKRKYKPFNIGLFS
jgi:predicted O-methyltransferase YrrM